MAGILKVDEISEATQNDGVILNNNVKVRLADNSTQTVISTSGNTTTLDNVTLGSSAVPTNNYTFRNLLINGNFDIWQRGTSRYSTYEKGIQQKYYADRWTNGQYQHAGFERNSRTGNGPKSKYVIKVTSSDSTEAPGGTRMALAQMIEAINCSHLIEKQITLSFWIRFSANASDYGNFTYQLSEYDTQDPVLDYTGATRTNPTAIASGNYPTDWTYYTHTITTASTMENLGARFLFTNLTNTTNNSDFWYEVAEVQLEEGPVATPFEHRPYGLELSLCQRYFFQNENQYMYFSARNLDNAMAATIPFPVEMRATPTITKVSDPAGFTFTWNKICKTCVSGGGNAPSNGYTDVCGVIQANAEL